VGLNFGKLSDVMGSLESSTGKLVVLSCLCTGWTLLLLDPPETYVFWLSTITFLLSYWIAFRVVFKRPVLRLIWKLKPQVRNFQDVLRLLPEDMRCFLLYCVCLGTPHFKKFWGSGQPVPPVLGKLVRRDMVLVHPDSDNSYYTIDGDFWEFIRSHEDALFNIPPLAGDIFDAYSFVSDYRDYLGSWSEPYTPFPHPLLSYIKTEPTTGSPSNKPSPHDLPQSSSY